MKNIFFFLSRSFIQAFSDIKLIFLIGSDIIIFNSISSLLQYLYSRRIIVQCIILLLLCGALRLKSARRYKRKVRGKGKCFEFANLKLTVSVQIGL